MPGLWHFRRVGANPLTEPKNDGAMGWHLPYDFVSPTFSAKAFAKAAFFASSASVW
jgi:hypothetical protein